MQILLTEEEYQTLLDAPKKVEQKYKGILQEVCTMAADNIPVDLPWTKGTPEPWQCIHSVDDYEHHCDKCPVIKHCPSVNNWSK